MAWNEGELHWEYFEKKKKITTSVIMCMPVRLCAKLNHGPWGNLKEVLDKSSSN